MNFLAHLHLSDGTPESMLGNVLADLMKGPQIAALPAAVRGGVRLHRLIDGFTDRHPAVVRSVSRLAPKLHWFSGIAVDVYYDHILARDWDRFCRVPLRPFADRAYGVLGSHLHLMPDCARDFVTRFIADDRLHRYATTEGIAETLSRLSDRIEERMPGKGVRLEAAMPDLLAADAELANDFHVFYPQLRAFAADQSRLIAAPLAMTGLPVPTLALGGV